MAEMLTAKEVQALLKVDRSTIYRMAEGHRLPAVKVGKQWRFPRDQIEKWLRAQSGGPVIATASTSSGRIDQLQSLLPLDCVQLIQDTFAETLGTMLIITDMSGKPLTTVSNSCGFFDVIHRQPHAVERCIQSWYNLATTIEVEPKLMPSALGLLCARGIIKVGTELKGMVVTGCIAPENWPPDSAALEQIALEFQVNPKTLQAQQAQVFYLNENERQKILTTIQRIANIVAHIAHERYTLLTQLETMGNTTT